MNRTTILLALAVAAQTAGSEVAHAGYLQCCGTNPVRWSSNSTSMNWCTSSFTAGDPWTQRISEAAGQWAAPSDSASVISVASDSNCNFNNTQNETWYTSGAGSNPDGWLQAEFTWFTQSGNCNGCTAPTITESDIVTYGVDENDVAFNWSTAIPQGSANTPSGSPVFVIVSYAHEMGHTLGFTHTDSGMVRMGPVYPNGGWYHTGTVVPLLTLDRQDAAIVYPASGTYLSQYMPNTQTRTADFSSQQLSYDPGGDNFSFFPRNAAPIAGQLPNRVRVGHTLQARICRGNLGPTAGNDGGIKVYRSTNRTWDASDVLLQTFASSALTARQRSCFTTNIVIPAGTPTGTYFLLAGINGFTDAQYLAAQDRSFVVIP